LVADCNDLGNPPEPDKPVRPAPLRQAAQLAGNDCGIPPHPSARRLVHMLIGYRPPLHVKNVPVHTKI
jgi:hypothetical protein